MEHPPEITKIQIELTRQAINELIEGKYSERVISIFFYPLRQVPMPMFISETLAWKSDTLKLFQPPVKFLPLEPTSESSHVYGYKRVDKFTALCLVGFGRTFAVFSNEIAIKSWELIGLMKLDSCPSPLGFSFYDTFENEFVENQISKASSTSPDSYWDQYDTPNNSVLSQQPSIAASENEYWNQYDTQKQQIDEDVKDVRPEAVQALIDLAGLYIDTGFDQLDLICADLLTLITGEPSSAPDIARRHAQRTWNWIKQGPTHIQELALAVEKIQAPIN